MYHYCVTELYCYYSYHLKRQILVLNNALEHFREHPKTFKIRSWSLVNFVPISNCKNQVSKYNALSKSQLRFQKINQHSVLY